MGGTLHNRWEVIQLGRVCRFCKSLKHKLDLRCILWTSHTPNGDVRNSWQSETQRNILSRTPLSLTLLVDFGGLVSVVVFFWWIVCGVFGPFSLERTGKSPPQIHDFQGKLLTQIHSGKFCLDILHTFSGKPKRGLSKVGLGPKGANQRRVNREVQTVNWEAGKEGGCRDRCQEGPEKGA